MPRKYFTRGHKRGGRKPGAVNKFTTLKQAFLEVFEKMGGADGLQEWAEKNVHSKKEFYSILSKMLPKEMSVQVEGEATLAEKIKSARARAGIKNNSTASATQAQTATVVTPTTVIQNTIVENTDPDGQE